MNSASLNDAEFLEYSTLIPESARSDMYRRVSPSRKILVEQNVTQFAVIDQLSVQETSDDKTAPIIYSIVARIYVYLMGACLLACVTFAGLGWALNKELWGATSAAFLVAASVSLLLCANRARNETKRFRQ